MRNKWLWIGIAILIIGSPFIIARLPSKPGKYDALAQCIKDSGAKYYGAFWCPNCKNQEAMFGRSARLLPRIECSTPDGRGQLPVCEEARIEGYPTWEFSNGTRVSGTQSLENLAEATQCELPQS